MIYLTSNGLSTEVLKKHFEAQNNHFKKVALITTASSFKQEDYHIPDIKSYFEQLHMNVILFDIEFEDVTRLYDIDIIYLLGGNPFYLLKQINDKHVKSILIKHLKEKKTIIGNSAGSMVLTCSLGLVKILDPEMNIDQISTEALNLVSIEVCPHFERFKDRYENFEARVQLYDKTTDKPLYTIRDGESLWFNNQTIDILK